jgi:hypothetical protein
MPQAPNWPNLHESLVMLSAILDEWCVAAAGTARMLEMERARRSGKVVKIDVNTITNTIGIVTFEQTNTVFGNVVVHGTSNTLRIGHGSRLPQWLRRRRPVNRFIRDISTDIRDLMHSKAQVYWRWREGKRREAHRRSLRTLMTIYFPGLLTDFIDATADRQAFAERYTLTIKQLQALTDSELNAFEQEAERTYKALSDVTNKLQNTIEKAFPLKSSSN